MLPHRGVVFLKVLQHNTPPRLFFSSFICHVRGNRDSLALRSLRAAFIRLEKHTLQSRHCSVGTSRSPVCQGHSWSLHGAGGCSHPPMGLFARDRPYSWDSVVSNSGEESRIANSLESRSRGGKIKPHVQENGAWRHRILTFLMLWGIWSVNAALIASVGGLPVLVQFCQVHAD